jgi:dienelactone hydrolase
MAQQRPIPVGRSYNTLRSKFEFRDGFIVKHYDSSNALRWAWQALPFPQSLIAGLIAPVRRKAAKERLDEFIASRPRLASASAPSAVASTALPAAAMTGVPTPFVSGGATHKMTIYPAAPYGEKRAVLVVLHGNAGLNPPFADLIHGFARDLATLGYVVAVPQYYADDGQHLNDIDPHPHVPALSDALAKVSERKDADVTRLGLVGYSLGAATAMTFIASRPAGTAKVLVDFFGPVFDNGTIASGAGKFPPTIILHNRKDGLVVIAHSNQLVELLTAQGIAHRFVPYSEDNPQFRNHPFLEGGPADVDSRKQATECTGTHLRPK